MQRKKIFFLLPMLHQASSAKVLVEFKEYFEKSAEMAAIVFEQRESPHTWDGKIFDLKAPFSLNSFLHIKNFFLRWWRFYGVMRREHPEYVISSMNTAHLLNLVCNHTHAVLRIVTFLSKSNGGAKGKLFNLFVRFFFRRAKHIVALSHAIKRDLVLNYGVPERKITVIYSPVNYEKARKLSQEPLPPAYEEIFTHPVVITVGRLCKQKGQWHIIKAFSQLKKTCPDARLVILGKGSFKKFLSELAAKEGVGNDVHFVGWDENPYRFLGRSKVFVLASLYEGLPNVMLEALACGLPVISTDCQSGPREILAPHTDLAKQTDSIEYTESGILIPVEETKPSTVREITLSEEMLSLAMAEVLTKEELWQNMHIHALRRIEDFRPDKILKEWEGILS